MPALLNTMWTPPSGAEGCVGQRLDGLQRADVADDAVGVGPAVAQRCTAASSAPCSMSASTSLAPFAASTCAVASPIPLAPPVITAPLPFNVSMTLLGSCGAILADSAGSSPSEVVVSTQRMTFVLRYDADGVATLTLNRPEKLNALNPATFKELRAHLDDVAGDATVRCLVLTGAGRSFCAGNDLDAIASGEGRAEPMLGPETVSALEELPQPTIAKIKGHCFTGGLELALACDFLIAPTRRSSATPTASGAWCRSGACRSACPSASAWPTPRT